MSYTICLNRDHWKNHDRMEEAAAELVKLTERFFNVLGTTAAIDSQKPRRSGLRR